MRACLASLLILQGIVGCTQDGVRASRQLAGARIASDCVESVETATQGGISVRFADPEDDAIAVTLIEAVAIVDDVRNFESIRGPLVSDQPSWLTATGPRPDGSYYSTGDPLGDINGGIGLRVPPVDESGKAVLEPEGELGYTHMAFNIEPSADAADSVAIYGYELLYDLDGVRYRSFIPLASLFFFNETTGCLPDNLSEIEKEIFEAQDEDGYEEHDRVTVDLIEPPG